MVGSNPCPIGNIAPSSSCEPDASAANPSQDSTSSQTSNISTDSIHPMVTRFKSGMVKPNPKYAPLIHKTTYPKPTQNGERGT